MADHVTQLAVGSGALRIAVVSPYGLDRPGGVQDQATRLAGWLRDDGHDAWVVAPGDSGPEGSRLVGAVQTVRTNRSRAPVALAPATGRRAVAAVEDADVVHLHEPFVPAVSLAILRHSDVAKVGTFHADPGGTVRWLYRWARPLAAKWVKRLDVTTAVSPVARRAIRPFVDPLIIPNGLDIAAYHNGAERIPTRSVFVGRDEPRKGLGPLLDAWPMVRRAVPEAELILVSDTARSLPEGVRTEGAVDDSAKRGLLTQSSVLVAPNTGGESFGLVVAEGMAAGCAVVASGLEAFAAVLGDTGRLVAPGDARGLADAISALLRDPENASRLGRQARERSRLFDRRTVVDAYVSAFEEAAASPK